VSRRVFKLKTFARWARKLLSDEQLCTAAREIQRGEYEADPGADFSDASVAQAQVIAQALQKTIAKKLDALIEDGVLKEICHGCQEI
jgi:hypothetical protein